VLALRARLIRVSGKDGGSKSRDASGSYDPQHFVYKGALRAHNLAFNFLIASNRYLDTNRMERSSVFTHCLAKGLLGIGI